jgi:hypothetical protein
MFRILIPVALLLMIGWVIACSRRGPWLRVAIVAAVPAGGWLGGYCEAAICLGVMRQQGGGDNAIAFSAAGMLGMLVGGIALPAIVWYLSRTKER